MKKILLIAILTFTGLSSTICQSKETVDPKLKAEIIELEKSGWNAFKTKDASWFEMNTTEEYFQVTAEGIANKKEVIQSLSDCNVKNFTFQDFQLVMLNKKALLLVYVVTQDGICGKEKLPAKARVAVNYVKMGGKWKEAFYMDAAMEE